MPRKLKANEPLVRRAALAKLKVVLMELTSVRPYFTADTDAATRAETHATLQRAATSLASLAEWAGELKAHVPGNTPPMGLKNRERGERKLREAPISMSAANPKAPRAISMSGGGNDSDE